MSNITLRYYQRESIEAQECAWWEYPRCVNNMPTGSGKTVTASVLISRSLPERTLFIADQEELCDQPLRVFQRNGIYAAVEKGKDRATLGASVVVASSQTLCRKKRRERFPRDHFSRILIDECHRGTERDIEICDYFETALVSGLTATPFRANLSNLSKWYGHVAYRMSPINFIEQGFMPPEDIVALPVEIDLEGIKTGMTPDGKDYKAEDADRAIEPYFDEIAELILKHAPGRFGIAYLPLIRSSKAFAACLRRHGITAMHVDGEMADRELVIAEFSRNTKDKPTFHWLCNAGVISTGVDIPCADAFLCLRPTHSPAWYQQARGRTWRVLPGVIDDLPEKDQAQERRERIAASDKPNTLIFDFLWQNDSLGVMRPGDMYAESQYDARQIFEATKKSEDPLHALEIAKRVQAEREAQVIKALQKAANQTKGNVVHAAHVGAMISSPELATYEPMSAWEFRPISDAQKNVILNFGIDPDTILNMGHASKIMDALIWRRKQGLATLKQVGFLRKHNDQLPLPLQIPNVEGMTMSEASSRIDVIMSRR